MVLAHGEVQRRVIYAQNLTLRRLNDLMLLCSCLGSLNNFEQGVLHFHFAMGTPSEVASPVLVLLDIGQVERGCVQSVSLVSCYVGHPWTEL